MANLETLIFEALMACQRQELPSNKARYLYVFGNTHSFICIHKEMLDAFRPRIAHLIEPLRKLNRAFEKDRYCIILFEDSELLWEAKRILASIAKTQMRSGRVRNAKGKHTKKHIEQLWEIQDGRCYFSGEPLGESFAEGKFHVDHLVPLARRSDHGDSGGNAGTNWPTNLALLVPKVNRLKRDDHPEAFEKRVKEEGLFKLRSKSERRAIDRKREKAFSEYIAQKS